MICCPQCRGKNGETFIRAALSDLQVFPDGTESLGDHEYTDDNDADCTCGWCGKVRDMIDDDEEESQMGCNYKIYGTITLRRSQEVELLLDALRERLDDGAVEVEELDENTIDLALNFDDATTIHTPPAMADLFQQMEPFVIGAGSFDIETSGDSWTEYVGTREEVAKARSASALQLIQEHIGLLTAEDRVKLGWAGQVIALQNILGALLGNILPPTAAELKDAQPGSLAYNWQRAKALLRSIPTVELPSDNIRRTLTTSTDVLKALISTVQATGGLVHFPDGSYGCAADEEWLDLADVILVAKQALENETGVVVELTIREISEES